jgi:hypothetical protein
MSWSNFRSFTSCKAEFVKATGNETTSSIVESTAADGEDGMISFKSS